MKVFMQTNGVINEPDKLNNFLFGDLGIDIDSLPHIPKGIIPQFNQYAYSKTKSGCTFVNSYRQACYIAGIQPTTQDYLDLIDYATSTVHYIPGTPRGVSGAIDIVRKFIKERNGIDLISFKTLRSSPEYSDLLKKGYPAIFSYQGNYAYNKDYQVDNELNGSKFGATTYGHCTLQELDTGVMYVNDSSSGNTYNRYKIDQLPALFQNSVYNCNVYFFIKTPETIDKDKIKRTTQLRANCQQISDLCTASKTLSNDSIFQSHIDETKQIMLAKIIDCNQILK